MGGAGRLLMGCRVRRVDPITTRRVRTPVTSDNCADQCKGLVDPGGGGGMD